MFLLLLLLQHENAPNIPEWLNSVRVHFRIFFKKITWCQHRKIDGWVKWKTIANGWCGCLDPRRKKLNEELPVVRRRSDRYVAFHCSRYTEHQHTLSVCSLHHSVQPVPLPNSPTPNPAPLSLFDSPCDHVPLFFPPYSLHTHFYFSFLFKVRVVCVSVHFRRETQMVGAPIGIRCPAEGRSLTLAALHPPPCSHWSFSTRHDRFPI